MKPFGVVEPEGALDSFMKLSEALVGVQVDALILQ
jgi:hypothetical protein